MFENGERARPREEGGWVGGWGGEGGGAVPVLVSLFWEGGGTGREGRRERDLEGCSSSSGLCVCVVWCVWEEGGGVPVPVPGCGGRCEREGGNGKLGTTSEGFPQYNRLGSVRHVCGLQGAMTS